MPLTPRGIELLTSAKEHILANPKFYDQSTLGDVTPCGTVCCIAGWIDYIQCGPEEHLKHVIEDPWSIWEHSRALLGLNEKESEHLFEDQRYHPDGQFVEEYRDAKTAKQRTEAAAGMIDRFIEKNK